MTSTSKMPALRVLKFGGSLLDLPDFPDRFHRYRQSLPPDQPLLMVVGGGESADVVRRFERHFNLGDHDGHWLAIRAMQFNAHCVAHVLGGELVMDKASCLPIWERSKLAIIDPIPWLEHEEKQGITIPHRWSFTSDSIAAHIATQLGAGVLTLFKSTLPATKVSPAEASKLGVVDDDFPQACVALPCVELVNLRVHPPMTLQLS